MFCHLGSDCCLPACSSWVYFYVYAKKLEKYMPERIQNATRLQNYCNNWKTSLGVESTVIFFIISAYWVWTHLERFSQASCFHYNINVAIKKIRKMWEEKKTKKEKWNDNKLRLLILCLSVNCWPGKWWASSRADGVFV